MEYGEAISSRSADRAFDIACRKLAGRDDLRRVAMESVAEAYCVCVVDGEDAAEGQLSAIHLDLVDQLAKRLERWAAEEAR